jgi:hypothetical protein
MTDLDEPNQAESTELAEAAALAEALDRDVALPDLPADALEAAAFLRFNAKDAELGAEAEARIFAELAPTLTAKPTASRKLRFWIWLAPMFALGAVTFVMVQQRTMHESASLRAHVETAEPMSTGVSTVDQAELELKQGAVEEALVTINHHLTTLRLAGISRPSPTLARLYELKAQAHERRGEFLLAKDSYLEALQINRQLMEKSLGQ